MASVLLKSVGIDHELLQVNASEPLPVRARSWTESQTVLSTFNEDIESGVSTKVVIGSVEILANNLGGLSVEGADLVVCLDEDWSGRGEMLLYSILSRILKRREMSGAQPCRFVRLVTANTCEAAFLKTDEVNMSSGRRGPVQSKSPNEKLPNQSYHKYPCC